MTLESRIKSVIRDVPDFPKPGILFKDITPMLSDPHLVNDVIRAIAAQYAAQKIDAIAAVEARGFIFGSILAQELQCAFVPMRKAGKLPYKTISQEYALEYAERTGQPVAALMIDVDFFKSINDRYGHAMGDRVLREVAKAIQSAARKDDSVSRIGGEEFLVVCHDADPRAALLAAERLRRMVKAMQIHIAGTEIKISVSIGVANRENGMDNEDDLLRATDKALYAAKKAGRDRVCLFANCKSLCTACTNGQRQA